MTNLVVETTTTTVSKRELWEEEVGVNRQKTDNGVSLAKSQKYFVFLFLFFSICRTKNMKLKKNNRYWSSRVEFPFHKVSLITLFVIYIVGYYWSKVWFLSVIVLLCTVIWRRKKTSFFKYQTYYMYCSRSYLSDTNKIETWLLNPRPR